MVIFCTLPVKTQLCGEDRVNKILVSDWALLSLPPTLVRKWNLWKFTLLDCLCQPLLLSYFYHCAVVLSQLTFRE